MRARVLKLAVLLFTVLTACTRPEALFNEQNARAHVNMLAGTIGSRPVGTPANARAREYLIEQLRLFGFDVRVQESDARRAEAGLTARVSNIIAVRGGARDDAVGLLSHYDSVPDAPGAADDAFGVAVSLEAARVLAARAERNWSLMVLVTDGEEAGLMGAAALVTDREVVRRLKAYINVEAQGSAGDAHLFETGPENGWLLRPWARVAPHPRGDSYALSVYRQLPSDTDFSVLKRHDIPGLNFALIGDSYAYHTARDTPERLSSRSLRDTGENVVAIVAGLDGTDITQRSPDTPSFFDINTTTAVTYGPTVFWSIGVAALVLGVIGWVRVSSAAIGMGGVGRWLLTMMWTIVGAAFVVGSMIAATWLLRVAREVYHPWYARPNGLLALLVAVGATVGWSVVRVGQWLPARAHGLRHPVVTWSAALPLWILLASLAVWLVPGAAHLWTLPLLCAGLLLSLAPPDSDSGIRIVSIPVLAVAGTMWLPDTVDLFHFAVAIFGRQPIVTPVYIYAVIMAAAAMMIVPPLVAVTGHTQPLLRPSLMTAGLLLAVAVAAGYAYIAPAYTFDEPLRRHMRAIQPASAGTAIWEVAGVEPGLDLEEGAPQGWSPASGPLPESIPLSPLPHPFVFRTVGPSLGPAPVTITGFAVRPLGEGMELALTVVPREPGLRVLFVLPAGFTPARASLPGVLRGGRWTATYAAVPAEGVAFRASFGNGTEEALLKTEVMVRCAGFPGGIGWQRMPSWTPHQRVVWTASAGWLLRPGADAIAPVRPLR